MANDTGRYKIDGSMIHNFFLSGARGASPEGLANHFPVEEFHVKQTDIFCCSRDNARHDVTACHRNKYKSNVTVVCLYG